MEKSAICTRFFLNVIVYCYSSYSLNLHCLGRTEVPCPPLCVSSGVWSLFLSGYAVLWGGHVVWCGRRVGVGVGGWGGGGWCACLWGCPCSHLNRASPAPSSHCGLCTLILCAGTRDPLMHRWVARTIVMATLLMRYPHVCE